MRYDTELNEALQVDLNLTEETFEVLFRFFFFSFHEVNFKVIKKKIHNYTPYDLSPQIYPRRWQK